jgi:hypothetical protein
MISIVLYGRNDSYGYNLHKRAALGINCMAEVLTQQNDEILFVDYNTPDDHPTFPEAIADTLTDNAIKRLRVFRVRPSIHDRLKGRTHLKAVEPVARNVAVRRSNPANRWILSTNTDMIFVPRGPASLSDIAATLADGFYHIPRFEIPESLWEGLDRRNPADVILRVGRFGRTMFLNEIVYGADCIKYDAPGDFQLMLRKDLFDIDGFNEDMLLGWHVDSNIAKRLYLVYGVVGDVVDRIFGYHCDHTRQVTPMHQHKAVSNDARVFIDDVSSPRVPHQTATWGYPDDAIEEISLSRSSHHVYMQGLGEVLEGEWAEPVEAHYTTGSFGSHTYDPRHVLPFLMDLFASAPRHLTAAWIGARMDTFRLFSEAWRKFGFEQDILIAPWSTLLLSDAGHTGVRPVSREDIASQADVVIFDFGLPSVVPESSVRVPAQPAQIDWAVGLLLHESFKHAVEDERMRLRGGSVPRQVVCIDAIHNRNEAMTREEITCASTPFASRLRHGFVIPRPAEPVDAQAGMPVGVPIPVLNQMKVGESGRRIGGAVHARLGHRGYLVTGPHMVLLAGDYQVEFSFEPRTVFTAMTSFRPIIIEVVAASECLVQQRVATLIGKTVAVPFRITDVCALTGGTTEFRIVHGRSVDFVLRAVNVTLLKPLIPPERDPRDSGRLLDLIAAQPANALAGTAAHSSVGSRVIASGTA